MSAQPTQTEISPVNLPRVQKAMKLLNGAKDELGMAITEQCLPPAESEVLHLIVNALNEVQKGIGQLGVFAGVDGVCPACGRDIESTSISHREDGNSLQCLRGGVSVPLPSLVDKAYRNLRRLKSQRPDWHAKDAHLKTVQAAALKVIEDELTEANKNR